MWSEVCTQCEAKNPKQSSPSCNQCRNSSHQSVQSAQSWVEVEWYGRILLEYFQNELQIVLVFTIWTIYVLYCSLPFSFLLHIYIQCLPNCISLCMYYDLWPYDIGIVIVFTLFAISLPCRWVWSLPKLKWNQICISSAQKAVNQC